MIQNKNFSFVGNVPACSASSIQTSYFGLGFEKLDRAVFDPEKAYDKIAALGIKPIRLQSGWQRTERSPGIYQFNWLDTIVNRLISLGMEPWICLCYGNDLYTERAKNVFGAVGCPPIDSPEERLAWHNYVTALTSHFQGRIKWYEVWNEPDGVGWNHRPAPNGSEYGNFLIATAKAIRSGDSSAKVIGGSFCTENLVWLNEMLQTDAGSFMDAFSYHAYTLDELLSPMRIHALRAVFASNGLPNMPFIQGETGCPSRDDGHGALCRFAMSPERQAKSLLRNTFTHLSLNVLFSSWFSSVDMIEALNGTVDNRASYLDYGYFGLLSADFDENGIATGIYSPKISYHAFQVITSVFKNSPEICSLPFLQPWVREVSNRTFQIPDDISHQQSVCFKRPNGSSAIVYWKPSDLMSSSYDGLTSLQTLCPGNVRLVDLMDGSIYQPNEKALLSPPGECRLLREFPLRDYPLAITFGDFF